MKRLVVFVLVIFLHTACDDNDPETKPIDPEITPVAVNYVFSHDQISEQSEVHEVVLLLAEAAEAAGALEIIFSSEAEYGSYLTTVPAVSGEKISLTVAEGDTEVSFSILPVNNTKLNGHKEATFTITDATGSVKLGVAVTYTLEVMDDELTNKLQKYEKTGSGLSGTKSSFEYNEDGQISKTHWEAKTVFGTTSGTDEYFYNETGGIVRISRLAGATETKYIWEDGVIVKVENLSNGVIMSYNVYEYDEAGRVKHVDIFTNNGIGEFASDFYTVYSYYEDGNVHQITSYSFDEDEDVFIVSSTTTYEGYIEGHNPFPLEVLPGKKIQTKLPTYYSRGSEASLLEFNVSYEFLENGNQTKKTVTGAVADSGVTVFTYY